jgi:hypothetical protein
MLALICLGICACSSAAPASSSNSDRIGPGTSIETDGGAPAVNPGTPGAHVWFPTSTGIELIRSSSYDSFPSGASISTHSCLEHDRAAMTPAELGDLAKLTLVPLRGGCTYDGFEYTELRVFDTDGTSAAYRDTACDYLMVKGATAMLPKPLPGGYLPANAPTCSD